MTFRTGAQIATVGLVAAGYVGAGWAAFFLGRGLDVRAYVRRAEAEAELREAVAGMWPDLERLGLAEGADPARLTVFRSLEEALAGCDFVQENAAEDAALKAELYASIDALLPPDVLIASSTSSLSVSGMQARCIHPERCVLGHPFTPTHLMRLVEVVGGTATAPEAVEAAVATYRHWGKVPVRLNREIFGHIGNRLASALWREAVHLLVEGVASVEDIDAAVVEGPGRKWAIAGPFESYHLSGGSGGIGRFLHSFSGGIQRRWDDLGRPRLDEGTQARIADLVRAGYAGTSAEDREGRRAALLVDLMLALDGSDPDGTFKAPASP